MNKNLKRGLAVAAVIVLVAAALFFFWYMRRAVPQIKVAEVKVGEVAAAVACSGVVAQETADLGVKIAGTVSWLGVDVGNHVKAGDVLLKLDSYEQARRDYDSINSLYKQGLASKQQLDVARNSLDAASVISPISGAVVKRALRLGEVAAPGMTIISVVNPEKTWIDVDIDEIDIGEVRNGEEARIYSDAYPDVTFFGAVYWISKAAELKKGAIAGGDEEEKIFKSKVSLLNSDGRLRHGMTVDVDVVYERKKGIAIIPREAVLFKDSRVYCFVVKGSRVYEREISIGIKDLFSVEVLKGPNVGEGVAISNLDKLRNRAIVSVQR